MLVKGFPKFDELLPHKGLILMFKESDSEVTEFDPKEKRIMIATEMKETDPRFLGHFEILPGAYQLEMMAQGGVLLVKGIDPGIEGLPALSTIESGKFSRPITPGSTVFTEVKLLDVQTALGGRSQMYVFEGTITNAKGKVCSKIIFTGMRYAGKKE